VKLAIDELIHNIAVIACNYYNKAPLSGYNMTAKTSKDTSLTDNGSGGALQQDKKEDEVVVDMIQLEADIQKGAPRVMRHMNADHSDSLKAYALAFGQDPNADQTQSAILTGLDVEGFWLELTLRDGRKVKDVLVPYDRRIQSAKELHQIAVDMHMAAFTKLGVLYKVQSGYYTTAFKMMGFQAYKLVKKRPYETAAFASITIFMAMAYGYRRYNNTVRRR
jgi:hypothetical protein